MTHDEKQQDTAPAEAEAPRMTVSGFRATGHGPTDEILDGTPDLKERLAQVAAFLAEETPAEAETTEALVKRPPTIDELLTQAGAVIETAFRLYAVEESTEIYAAVNAEQARRHVEELTGETLAEDEVWETNTGAAMRLNVEDSREILREMGIRAPRRFRLTACATSGESEIIGFSQDLSASSVVPPMPWFTAYAEVTEVVAPVASVAAAMFTLGHALPFMVCSSYGD